MDYFSLFDFPQNPVIDKSTLARKYFELQKKHHPDFFSQQPDEEKEEAMERSAEVNKAFRIFSDEDQTLAYFLESKGWFQAEEKYNLPASFLMEMMELNEASLMGSAAEVQERVKTAEAAIREPVSALLQPSAPKEWKESELAALKDYYYKKKYLRRILERLVD